MHPTNHLRQQLFWRLLKRELDPTHEVYSNQRIREFRQTFSDATSIRCDNYPHRWLLTTQQRLGIGQQDRQDLGFALRQSDTKS